MQTHARTDDNRIDNDHLAADATPNDTGGVMVDVAGDERERLLALLAEHGFRATSAPAAHLAEGGPVRPLSAASRARLRGMARATGEGVELEDLYGEERYRLLLDTAPDIIAIVRIDGTIEFLSGGPMQFETGPFIGANAFSYLSAADAEAMRAALSSASSTGELTTFEISVGAMHLRSRVRRLPAAQGGPVEEPRLLVFATDVTQQHLAEEALERAEAELEESRRQFYQAQKMESIGRLAGGIAHDFNNLLTAIISFTRFVKDDLSEGDPRREDLTEVLRAADSAAQLTSQLLAFSRRRPVEATRIELNTAVLHIDKMLRRTLGEDVELVILPSPEPAHVLVDAGALDQLIFNLAVNARDAMPGGGTLTIAISREDAGPDAPEARSFAVLTMRDTGTGLSPEIADRIFEPFFTTKGEAGTGLGLATCYGIVMRAGGEIRLDPEVRPGACFRVKLPLAGNEDGARESAARPKTREAVRPGTVVVVEDQPAILRMMFRTLRKIGFAALEARSAEEALALTDRLSARIDLLVTDVVLPGLSGVELMQRLRSRQPALRTVLVSGYLGTEEPLALLDSHTSFLPKPFSAEHLVAKIEALLGPSDAIAAG